MLGERKRLAIHSGSLGDGAVELMERGIVTRADCGVLMGTRRLFEHARENAAVRLRSTEYTHDPRVLAGIERFVAINSAVEVDLTGQVNAEVAKGSYLGAVGGALDFIRAASQSAGGVSLMLLPAARIVEKLQGPVATPRSEAGIVVTERGATDLRGCTLRERERRLRAIC
jgi:acetyl-CoA hydrolase